MITEEVRVIADKIGQFFLDKCEGDYEACNNRIRDLLITEISISEENNKEGIPQKKVTIKTARPGRLIGKRGEIIDGLIKFLGISIHIVEEIDHITDLMYQHEPSDLEYDLEEDKLCDPYLLPEEPYDPRIEEHYREDINHDYP